jgi:plasmid stabilization system protein ParE
VPVEIVWSPLARARLKEIRAFVALDKPEAAKHLATRIVAVVETLRLHPHLGRAGYRGNALLDTLSGTPAAGDYQYYLAWRAGKMIGRGSS